MTRNAVTIRDIADKAGVSASTVSRVLTGTTPVAPSKRAAVLAAVKTLNYRPNIVAQGLARGHSRAIGVLTEQISNSFYSQILGGIEHGVRGTGYYPVFASGNGPEGSAWALDLFLSYPVDGIVIVGGRMPDEELASVARQIPLVAIGRSIRGLEDRCLHVANIEGAYSATRFLIELGHRRIAHITGPLSHPDSLDRRAGYERALADEGISIDPRLVVEGDFEEESGARAAEELLRRRVRFTAIFAGNDQMACGAGLALFRRNLRVPRDVSLVGFDDEPTAAYTWPPLSTVRQPTTEMGCTAIRALVENLEGRPFTVPRVRTELVIRESTASPRQPSGERIAAVARTQKA